MTRADLHDGLRAAWWRVRCAAIRMYGRLTGRGNPLIRCFDVTDPESADFLFGRVVYGLCRAVVPPFPREFALTPANIVAYTQPLQTETSGVAAQSDPEEAWRRVRKYLARTGNRHLTAARVGAGPELALHFVLLEPERIRVRIGPLA